MRHLLAAFLMAATATVASAQQQNHGGHQPAAQVGGSPYAEFRTRPIKALSQQQVDDLQAGRGMGLALAAELNSYPGPMHVLEHERALALTPAQKTRMEALMATTLADAIKAGGAVIAAERELDQLFPSGRASEAALRAAVAAAAQAHGEARTIHLATHIKVRAELNADQIAAYNRLRGYNAP